ncbi:MAG: RHS repeat-associated core domain-containing protein, partial [Christensenellaceae bacterium]|nr:RHS repeat-associated core domain-containing protein [Christensenellaceae bacterium]
YGNTTSPAATVEDFTSSFAYAGAVLDEETGLYYMNARYYEPELGRFISQDTFDGSEGFWHEYLYCDSDPVNFTDPSGHAPKQVLVGVGLQLEVSLSALCISGVVGLEIIWYTAKQVSGKNKNPYIYWYVGGSIGQSKGKNIMDDIVKQAIKKPKSLLTGRGLSLSASASAFMIWGNVKSQGKYKAFKNPSDYEGVSDCVSGTVFHVKGYVATGPSCTVYGIGISSAGFEISRSKVRYKPLNNKKLATKAKTYKSTAMSKSKKAKM